MMLDFNRAAMSMMGHVFPDDYSPFNLTIRI